MNQSARFLAIAFPVIVIAIVLFAAVHGLNDASAAINHALNHATTASLTPAQQ